MPDVIASVEFRSAGAPAKARVGEYPIYPGRIKFEGPVRARYSVRYVPGTMTVSPVSPGVQFTRKYHNLFGNPFSGSVSPAENGEHTLTLPWTPTPGRMVVVVLIGNVTNADPLPSFVLSGVRTGGGSAYTQIGTDLVCENTDTANPFLNSRKTMSVWWRIAAGGGSEEEVKFTTSLSSDLGAVSVAVLEYSGVSSSPITDVQTREVDVVDGSGSDVTLTLPDIDLNGTTGQLVLAVFSHYGDETTTRSPAAYSFRYRSGATFDPTAQDIDSLFPQAATAAIIDRAGLNGSGQEQPTVTVVGAYPYVAMGIALRKA